MTFNLISPHKRIRVRLIEHNGKPVIATEEGKILTSQVKELSRHSSPHWHQPRVYYRFEYEGIIWLGLIVNTQKGLINAWQTKRTTLVD